MYVSIDIFAHKYHRVLFYNFAGLESVSKFKYENDGRLDSCLDIDDVTAIVGFKKNKNSTLKMVLYKLQLFSYSRITRLRPFQ